MILASLFMTFFKIGLFSFGGGYAMIPLIQTEMQSAGWLDSEEFADLVSISQMTPGPIGINAATYVGYRTAGIPGSICATLGVFLPSFVLIMVIAAFFEKFSENRMVKALLSGIRPATIGLIFIAVLFFVQVSVFSSSLGIENVGRFLLGKKIETPFSFILNTDGFIIFLLIFLGITFLRLSIISAILISAVLGIFFF
jgi:chromate transporter